MLFQGCGAGSDQVVGEETKKPCIKHGFFVSSPRPDPSLPRIPGTALIANTPASQGFAYSTNGITRKRKMFVNPCASVTPTSDRVRATIQPKNVPTTSTNTRSTSDR